MENIKMETVEDIRAFLINECLAVIDRYIKKQQTQMALQIKKQLEADLQQKLKKSGSAIIRRLAKIHLQNKKELENDYEKYKKGVAELSGALHQRIIESSNLATSDIEDRCDSYLRLHSYERTNLAMARLEMEKRSEVLQKLIEEANQHLKQIELMYYDIAEEKNRLKKLKLEELIKHD